MATASMRSNLIGNGVATTFVAQYANDLDIERLQRQPDNETNEPVVVLDVIGRRKATGSKQ